MSLFITSQAILAETVGISSQWLSTVKHACSAGDALLVKLEAATGIPQVYWASPIRSSLLEQKLETFLNQEKDRERQEGVRILPQ